MKHYSCDRCGKEISSNDDHFVLMMELHPKDDAMTLTEEDVDEDNLHQISETLKALEAQGEEYLLATRPAKFQFDLCNHCRDQFLKNPLSAPAQPKMNFSEN